MKTNQSKFQVFTGLAIVIALLLAFSLSRYSAVHAGPSTEAAVVDQYSVDFSLSSLNTFQQKVIKAYVNEHAAQMPVDISDYTVTVEYYNSAGELVVGMVPTDVYASHWSLPLPDNTPVFLTLVESGDNGWAAVFLPKPVPSQRSVSADYRFPWTNGHAWLKTQGYHYQSFGYSIDFSPGSNGVLNVLAIESGLLQPVCSDPYQAMVKVTHATGVRSGYLHLSSNSVPSGNLNQNIPQGLVLGQTYTGSAKVNPHSACIPNLANYKFATACGCGTDTHLHFEVSSEISIQGISLPSISSAPYRTAYTSTNGAPPPGDTVTVSPNLNKPGTCPNGWATLYDGVGFFTANSQNEPPPGQVPSNFAEWRPTIAKTGRYQIEAYIGNHGTNFCGSTIYWDTSKAQYQVYHDAGSTIAVVDQKPRVNEWVTLGEFNCTAGQACYVRLTDVTGEPDLSRTVSFSYVRFTLKSTPPAYSISGSITDGNGSGLAGVSVSTGANTAQTDGNGNYAITGLPAGTHTVNPSKAEYTFSPSSRSVTVGPNATGVNFTATLVTYSIRGRVSDSASGAGISGAAVSAGGKTAQSDGAGNYTISGLGAGNYNVSVSKSGYGFNPTTRNVTLGPDASGVDFTGTAATFSIRGTVTEAGSALSGVSISAGGKTAITDASGNYTISGLAAGPYTVTPSRTGYSFNPATRSVTLGPDANGVDFAGTAGTFSIRGTVTAEGSPLSGVSVSTSGKTATTDASGNYTISGLGAGSYTVTPSRNGYSFNPSTRSVTVGPDASGVNFVGSTTLGGTRLIVHPATQTVALGASEFCITVRVEKTTELHAFEFTLGFPPDLLEAKRVTLGPFLGSTGRDDYTLPVDINNTTGRVKFAAYTMGPNAGPTGDGELATVCFMPEKAGTAALDMSIGKLSGPNGATIPVTLADGSVDITSCYFADFDCNNEVDIYDVQAVAGRWQTKAEDPGFDAKYDVVPNGEIDVFDVQRVASEYGWPENRQAPQVNRPVTPLTFSIDPAALDLEVGQTRQIALKVTDAQNLGAFEIGLDYDPSLIRVNSVTLTGFLESTGREAIVLGPDIDNVTGQVRFGAATIGTQPGATGDGQIVLIEVTALAVGDGQLDLHSGRASDPTSEPMTVSMIDGSYQISEAVSEEYQILLPAVLSKP